MSDNPGYSSGSSAEKGKKQMMALAIILAVIIVILLIWFLPMKSKYVSLLEEKEIQHTELQNELNSLMTRHDSVRQYAGALADSLRVKDSVIRANAVEIQELLNYKWEYGKVNKKLDLLRKITQGYVHQIDSLYVANKQLKEENERISGDYAREQEKTQRLLDEKDVLNKKVNEAAMLKAYNIKAAAYRVAGTGKEKETDKSDKVDKVKVCFTLGVNKLVDQGPKTVYLRIARPDKVIVSQRMGDVYTFEYKGEKIEYTSKKDVDYNHVPQDLCMTWSKKSKDEPAMVGVYYVTLFVDGLEIGEGKFELK